jgi:hypothetical protein
MEIVELSKLESVTVSIALFTPTATLPKLISEGYNEDAGSPTPVSAAVTGLLVALEVIKSDEGATIPTVVGVRVMPILQKPPRAATGAEVEQLVEGSNA